jgi:hypothetical protein
VKAPIGSLIRYGAPGPRACVRCAAGAALDFRIPYIGPTLSDAGPLDLH